MLSQKRRKLLLKTHRSGVVYLGFVIIVHRPKSSFIQDKVAIFDSVMLIPDLLNDTA